MGTYTKQERKESEFLFVSARAKFTIIVYSKLGEDYALKQIEGSGISMSACREIAVQYSLC